MSNKRDSKEIIHLMTYQRGDTVFNKNIEGKEGKGTVLGSRLWTNEFPYTEEYFISFGASEKWCDVITLSDTISYD